MSRFALGFVLAPGSSVRVRLTVTNLFNGSGDWGNRFALAHPRNPGALLLSTAHGKVLNPGGTFTYVVTTTNAGPFATLVDIDF
jgi:hypothetical protein